MSFSIDILKRIGRTTLNTIGLLAVARWSRQVIFDLTDMKLQRRNRAYHQRFKQFKRKYENVLRHGVNGVAHERKIALIGSCNSVEVHLELAIIKALELAGFMPVVLIVNKKTFPPLPKYYHLVGIKEIHYWNDFASPLNLNAAKESIDQYQSVEELLTFKYKGVKVGKYAVSTALRCARSGSLDLQSPQDRETVIWHVASVISFVDAGKNILQKFQPKLAVLVDHAYSPKGELLDQCLANGIDTITYQFGHKSNVLMFKRTTPQNVDMHVGTLSDESWKLVREMDWTGAHREQIEKEIYSNYANGDWFSVAGTQLNKRFESAAKIRKQLGLDPQKKTAFIFPHISWDATLFWSESLFNNYDDWFVETVRIACENDHVNWVIKIHPANIGKVVREGVHWEPGELITLNKHIDKLPPHIFMIPAESGISTYSMFDLMDYCVTVRSTVGIEAARLGIPVLTAGIGPYDQKGFTIDSETREQYLERIAKIQEILPLSPAQQELADRFAYGYFILRPLPLTTTTLKYDKSGKTYLAEGRINIGKQEEWKEASDIKALAQWLNDRSQVDFLMPLSEKQNEVLI